MFFRISFVFFLLSLALASPAGAEAASPLPPVRAQSTCEQDMREILDRINALESKYLSRGAGDTSQGTPAAVPSPSHKELSNYNNSVYYIDFKIKNMLCSDLLAYRIHAAFYPCYKLIGDIWRAREYCKDASAKNRMRQLIDLADALYPKITTTISDSDLGACLQVVAAEGLEEQGAALQKVAELVASKERTLRVLDAMLQLVLQTGTSRIRAVTTAVGEGQFDLQTRLPAPPDSLR